MGLSKTFGGVRAVQDVSLSVESGMVHGLIGPNGAGKSTLFNMISGVLPADSGEIRLEGRQVNDLPAHRRAALGVAIVFQTVRLVPRMTVLENVMLGAHARMRHGYWEAFLRLPRHRREERAVRASAEVALQRTQLEARAAQAAGALPLGLQRSVQIARSLCANPRLVLLDEPASGLRGKERDHLADLIRELPVGGVAVLLVEHDVAFVANLARTITVMDRGRVIAQDTPNEVLNDPSVISSYIGADPDGA